MRHRDAFAYIDGELPGGEVVKLMRPRYGETTTRWGFALYHAGSDRYEGSLLPAGGFDGRPEDALDCACGVDIAAADI